MGYCPHCMHPVSSQFCPYCGCDVTKPKWSSHYLPIGSTLTVNGGWHTYQVGEALGQGGFGITYIGVLLETKQRVAIKEYFPSRCAYRTDDHRVCPKSGSEELFAGGLKSFLKEAKLLAGLKPLPSVVRALDFFQENGTAYLVMEYLEGMPLSKKVEQDGRISPKELLPRMKVFLEDLDSIHKESVVHRDVAPDNIMWMPDGTLKLMDFGCARSMEDGKSARVVLKPGFAPVEQYQSRGQGPWTDVYGIAASIYYCLTTKVPPEAIDRLDVDTLASPKELGVDLSLDEEQALMWGLAVQPKFRPESVEQLSQRMFPAVTPARVLNQMKEKILSIWENQRSVCIGIACGVGAFLLLLLLTGCANQTPAQAAAQLPQETVTIAQWEEPSQGDYEEAL